MSTGEGVRSAAGRSGVADEEGAATRPMRVCLLIGQLGLGGTEKQITLLARGLRGEGVETTVLVMFHGGPHEETLREAGVPVVHLGFRRKADGWWRALPACGAAFVRLLVALRRLRPDVLHAFLFYGYVVAAPAALLARVPVFVIGRRNMGFYRRGHRFWSVLDRLAAVPADLLIANARAVADVARRQGRVPREKVALIYNGLPDDAFTPAPPAEIGTDLPVVLCVANLLVYKGHRHLVEGLARLGELGRPCTLVLVGEGPERPALVELAARRGVDARFLGPRTDVPRLLPRADVVVLASLHEGLSNAVMEAMAAGRPVVATEVGGTGELLAGGRGLLVPPADPDALAAGVGKVLADPGLAGELGVRARAWSRANLHADAMVNEHIRVYRTLMEG